MMICPVCEDVLDKNNNCPRCSSLKVQNNMDLSYDDLGLLIGQRADSLPARKRNEFFKDDAPAMIARQQIVTVRNAPVTPDWDGELQKIILTSLNLKVFPIKDGDVPPDVDSLLEWRKMASSLGYIGEVVWLISHPSGKSNIVFWIPCFVPKLSKWRLFWSNAKKPMEQIVESQNILRKRFSLPSYYLNSFGKAETLLALMEFCEKRGEVFGTDLILTSSYFNNCRCVINGSEIQFVSMEFAKASIFPFGCAA